MKRSDYITKTGPAGKPWQVHSEAGKVLGSYASETQAKERLRQIEAAKAAKGDGGATPARVSRRCDAGVLSKFERTPSGGMVIPADLTRSGVLVYRSPDGTPFRELRPQTEVFARDSYCSLEGAPVTDLHPDDDVMVDATNWKQLAVGGVCDVQADGDKIAARLQILDASMIALIEAGERVEVSCGYSCDLEMTSGIFEGQPYDAIQRNIRYNHAALGPSGWGRAGSDVALRLDSAAPGDKVMRKVKIDGVEYEAGSDSHLQAVDRQLERAAADTTRLTAELATANGRADGAAAATKIADEKLAAEKKRADAAASQEAIDKRVADRMGLVDKARRIMGAEYDYNGKADADIMRDTLTKGGMEVAADADEAYMRGAFDAVTAGGGSDDPDQEFVGADAADVDDAAGGKKDKKDGKAATPKKGVRVVLADGDAPDVEGDVLAKVRKDNAAHEAKAASRFRFQKSA